MSLLDPSATEPMLLFIALTRPQSALCCISFERADMPVVYLFFIP